MSRSHQSRIVPILLAWVVSLPIVLAQGPPPPEPDDGPPAGEVREAIKQFFEHRMREELGLTDEQMSAMRPLVDEIERSRAATRRERLHTIRALRGGLRDGAGDARLQELLDRLGRIEDEERARQRSVMTRIDEQLTVRQRVQFRFFIDAFRRRMERRIRELRDERVDAPGGKAPDRRLPPPDRR